MAVDGRYDRVAFTRVRGVHVLALAAIVLGAVALRATEFYALHYQSLPVLDWVESRPPLAESTNVPAASDLAQGLPRTLPLLAIRDDVRPRLLVLGPPASVERTIGGVRDAARIVLASPGSFGGDEPPVQARLDVIVFNRALRAAAWTQLMGRQMDVRDPDNGLYQTRLSGPDEPDGLWVVQPRQTGGIATVVGHRDSVAFVMQFTLLRPDPLDLSDVVDFSARAEAMARLAAGDWTAWLDQQVHT